MGYIAFLNMLDKSLNHFFENIGGVEGVTFLFSIIVVIIIIREIIKPLE